MNLEKLKDTARKLEQKEDWRKAIEVYLRAIQQAESGAETTPDLSLYNRVGDLYLKINDTAEAVRSYERAVDLYADQGFFNNAIALCGKILRVNPGRTQTYLKLSQLHARKNVVIEAKRNLIEFLERMNALGQLDQAFQAVKLFADQFSGSQEIRSMLVELLRASSREDEAREQLEKMALDLEAMGDKAGARRTRDRLHTSESDMPSAPAPAPPPATEPRRGDLIFLDTGVDLTSPAPSAPPRGKEAVRPSREHSPVEELPPPVKQPPVLVPEPLAEPATDLPADMLVEETELPSPTSGIEDLIIDPLVHEEPSEDSGSLLGIERIDGLLESDSSGDSVLDIQRQQPSDVDLIGMTVDGLEQTNADSLELLGASSLDSSSLDMPEELTVSLTDGEPGIDLPSDPDPALEADIGFGASIVQDAFPPQVEPESRPAAEERAPLTLADLENRVLDDPENPDIHLELAEALLVAREMGRVGEEFELALAGYEDQEDWGRAAEMADRLVALVPDSITYHQKRVELAYRTGDRGPLLEAYLGLGDALGKSGAIDKALAVYGRVIDHDPGNAKAAAAIKRLGGAQAAEAAAPAPKSTVKPPPSKPEAPRAPGAPAPTPPAAPTPVPVPPAPTPAPAPAAKSRPAAASEDFVDFGSMVLDDEGSRRDTRMRVDRREPSHQDEQREFQEILEQFKRGIDQNLDSEDHQSHYDLGVAFREMGLLDEAIGEFQKALRSPEGRLRTTEALGMTFFEKGQHAVCESVLRRALESLDGSDDAKIGLLYWLGRASEALGKEAEAVASYERAMVVDIRFMDLSQRVQRLTSGRRR
jgi:tetratricopeptide (TPR) repeat protein